MSRPKAPADSARVLRLQITYLTLAQARLAGVHGRCPHHFAGLSGISLSLPRQFRRDCRASTQSRGRSFCLGVPAQRSLGRQRKLKLAGSGPDMSRPSSSGFGVSNVEQNLDGQERVIASVAAASAKRVAGELN